MPSEKLPPRLLIEQILFDCGTHTLRSRRGISNQGRVREAPNRWRCIVVDKQRISRKQQTKRTKTESSRDLEKRMHATEDEPAVERGERIATGKAIARGGRRSGFVPGTSPSSHEKS